ncbi:MAG: bifunctional oligoribonuclease/PAP phosphatase NrnA [Nitrospira sp.]|nr:bifunctional oligoribonuclease/PAP phosphatase NrnA [Nitrospira sp.]
MDYIILCQDELPYFLLLLIKSPCTKKDTIQFIVDQEELYNRLQGMGVPAKVVSFTNEKERLVKELHPGPESCFVISIKNHAVLSGILKTVSRYFPYQPVLIIEENGITMPEQLCAKMVRPSTIFTDLCLPKIEEAFIKRHVQYLKDLFAGKDKILLLIQADPDPDAIASALAFRHLIGRNRTTAHIASFGEVTRPENVAMLRLLDIQVEKIVPDVINKYDGLCLLDVQPAHLGEAMNQVNIPIDVVIDHHPEKPGYQAKIKDIRATYGATSTILTEYLRAVDFNISQRLATALLYGIKSDTLLLGRGVDPADINAFSYLYPQANSNILRKIERPEVLPEDIDSFSNALKKRKIVKNILFSHLGKVQREDVIPQFADFSLQIEGVEWSVVSGIFRGNLVISVRNVGYVRSAGVIVKKAFGELGSAGGHSHMAKAVIPLKNFYKRLGDRKQATFRGKIVELFLSGFEETTKEQEDKQ